MAIQHSCLVTGAAGFVGSHLAEALLARGHDVAGLVRRTSNLAWLNGLSVRLVHGDVTAPESLPSALEGVDYVYHVAGVTKALTPADYFRINTAGTANVLAACRAVSGSLRRVVVVSSLAALGPPVVGQPGREDDPPHPCTPYGLSKLRAEELAAASADQLPIAVVRPPAIYGPRDRETLLYYRWISRGLRPIPRGSHVLSLIHVRDLARGLIMAGEHANAPGRTYNLANQATETLDGVTGLMAEALGARALTVRLPIAGFRVAAALNELIGRLAGRPQIFDRGKLPDIAHPYWVCDVGRAEAELGFRASIPTRDGIRETADWYRSAGWL